MNATARAGRNCVHAVGIDLLLVFLSTRALVVRHMPLRREAFRVVLLNLLVLLPTSIAREGMSLLSGASRNCLSVPHALQDLLSNRICNDSMGFEHARLASQGP